MYLQGIMTYFDQIAILKKTLDHEDQINMILEGLSKDYKQWKIKLKVVMSTFTTKRHERLLNHEWSQASGRRKC